MDKKFSHLNKSGDPTMVDVSEKDITSRTATARSLVLLDEAIISRLENDEIHTRKGPVFKPLC